MHRILFALLLLAPAVHAGTADAPEIYDETGDTYLWPGEHVPGPIADAMDLTAVWVTYQSNIVTFHMQVHDLAPAEVLAENAAGDARWWVNFQPLTQVGDEVHTEPWEAEFFLSQGAVWRTSATLRDAHGQFTEVTGELDVAANEVRVEVPLKLLGIGPGGVISDLYSRTGTYFPAYPVWIGDDGTHETGHFVIPGQPPSEEVVVAEYDSDEAPVVKGVDGEDSSLGGTVEAPGAPLAALVAGIALVAFLRRK